MKLLIQRVSEADVQVAAQTVGKISQGLLVLLGLEKGDDFELASRMIDKLLSYRIFADDRDKMNLSVTDISGGILLVSQFTLAADTKKGLRPGFSSALAPKDAEKLYEQLLVELRSRYHTVEAGLFGADMQVSLVNDGPVTFMLES